MSSLYTDVATHCSSFDPKMEMFKMAKGAGEPTCLNCKSFKNDHCVKQLFDPIKSNLK